MKRENDNRDRELTPRDLSYFCRQISLMMDAGISVENGISLMWDDEAGSRESALLSAVRNSLEQGLPFFLALEQTGRFPEYLVRMTKIGEACGNLDQVMEGLANYYDREAQLRKTLRNALMYPAVMVSVMLLVMLALSTQVMPVFCGVLAQLEAQSVPLIVIVIRMGGVVSGVGLGVMAVLFVFAGIASVFGNRSHGQVSRILRKLKSRGRTSALVSKSRVAQVLSITLRSGINLEEGFSMAENLVVNRQVKTQTVLCREAMQSGELFADAVGKAGLFNGIQGQMIRMGQRAGRLDEMLGRIGEECAAEADDRIDSLLAKLEPALIVILSAAVGGMLLLVMLPLIGILSSLG